MVPSHRKPTSPQMKSEQLWQKVGLVSVTLLRQCPGAELRYRGRASGDCWDLFFGAKGLGARLSAASIPAGVLRPPESAMAFTHTQTHKAGLWRMFPRRG